MAIVRVTKIPIHTKTNLNPLVIQFFLKIIQKFSCSKFLEQTSQSKFNFIVVELKYVLVNYSFSTVCRSVEFWNLFQWILNSNLQTFGIYFFAFFYRNRSPLYLPLWSLVREVNVYFFPINFFMARCFYSSMG